MWLGIDQLLGLFSRRCALLLTRCYWPGHIDGLSWLGFTNCTGAIDRTNVPILCSSSQASGYINRKGYFSVVLQGLVDGHARFININMGWSGKVSDVRILKNPDLFNATRKGTFAPKTTMHVKVLQLLLLSWETQFSGLWRLLVCTWTG